MSMKVSADGRLRAPKRVRRFITERRVHAGKFQSIENIYGDKVNFWAPLCITEKRLLKVRRDVLNRTPSGRALTSGATAPITCPRCITILEES